MASWKIAQQKRKEEELRIEKVEAERLEKQYNEGREKEADQEIQDDGAVKADAEENEIQNRDDDGTEEQEEK